MADELKPDDANAPPPCDEIELEDGDDAILDAVWAQIDAELKKEEEDAAEAKPE